MVNYSKEWKKISKQILKRDKQCRGRDMVGRCTKESVDAHHIVPKWDGGKDTKENGVGLCKRNHAIADNTYRKYGLTRMAKIWLKENLGFKKVKINLLAE